MCARTAAAGGQRRDVCFSASLPPSLGLSSDLQWARLLVPVGSLPYTRRLTICLPRDTPEEGVKGGCGPRLRPLLRVPSPQLTDIDLGGCAMGDVATLGGLCRAAPLDSLVPPRALPAPRRLTAAAQEARLEVMAVATRAAPAAPRRVVVSVSLSFADVAAQCAAMRGAATADVTVRLRNRHEVDDFDAYDQDELDPTARVAAALAALAPRRLFVENLWLSAPEEVLLAVPSRTALELRAPALGHSAAGGIFYGLTRHWLALQSLTISNWDGELANAVYVLCAVMYSTTLEMTTRMLCHERPCVRARLHCG